MLVESGWQARGPGETKVAGYRSSLYTKEETPRGRIRSRSRSRCRRRRLSSWKEGERVKSQGWEESPVVVMSKGTKRGECWRCELSRATGYLPT